MLSGFLDIENPRWVQNLCTKCEFSSVQSARVDTEKHAKKKAVLSVCKKKEKKMQKKENAVTSTTQQRSSTRFRTTLLQLRLVQHAISVLACYINKEWLLHWRVLKQIFVLFWATPVFPLPGYKISWHNQRTSLFLFFPSNTFTFAYGPRCPFGTVGSLPANVKSAVALSLFIVTLSVTCPFPYFQSSSSLFLEMGGGGGRRCRSWSQPRLRASFCAN